MRQCPNCKQEFDSGVVFCPTDGERLLVPEDEEDEEEVDPLIGELIDNKYLIEEKVARGGTATVYRARHIQLDLSVALKMMHSHLTVDKTAIERFRREALAAMYIRHPNAIAVLDFAITANGMVYVVTEFLSGVTLRDRIMAQHTFSLIEANEIIQQICAAVAVAHKRQIIHRDLKPDNIFLHQDGGQELVKVLDFGIAKMGEANILTEANHRLTRQGFVLGTPHYMSPEQCADKEVDHRTDIYSMGVVLYEMLTGYVPFNGRSYSAIVTKKVREKPRPSYELRPDIPQLVDAVIMRAMAKKAEERPDSILAFGRELEFAIRAATEQEFKNIFEGASDRELEAAILLVSEPGRTTANLGRYGTDISIANINTDETRENPNAVPVEIKSGLKESNDPSSTSSQKALRNSSFERTATPAALLQRPASHYDELLQLSDDGPKLLRQEMQQLSKEMSMLLQIVIFELDNDNPLDPLFFGELRNTVDSLRAVMYHLQHHYEQNASKEESNS